jgi:hypothetical protein
MSVVQMLATNLINSIRPQYWCEIPMSTTFFQLKILFFKISFVFLNFLPGNKSGGKNLLQLK